MTHDQHFKNLILDYPRAARPRGHPLSLGVRRFR
jgi:hypothetical protein